jgi:hypothetical protein
MVKVTLTQKLSVSADDVWEAVGGFNQVGEWHELVEKSELEDGSSVRRLTNAGGEGQLVERLLYFDDEARTYSYTIVDAVDFEPPVVNYLSVFKIIDDGEGRCTVSWTGSGDPAPGKTEDDCIEGWNLIYGTGLRNLAEKFGAG